MSGLVWDWRIIRLKRLTFLGLNTTSSGIGYNKQRKISSWNCLRSGISTPQSSSGRQSHESSPVKEGGSPEGKRRLWWEERLCRLNGIIGRRRRQRWTISTSRSVPLNGHFWINESDRCGGKSECRVVYQDLNKDMSLISGSKISWFITFLTGWFLMVHYRSKENRVDAGLG